MQLDLVATAWAAGWPPAFGLLWRQVFRSRLYEGWACAGAGGVLSFGLGHQPVPAAISALQLLLAVFLWWLSRRRRKRAPKAMGAKSRALLAAVVAKMRERTRPRPVLRPAPGGAQFDAA